MPGISWRRLVALVLALEATVAAVITAGLIAVLNFGTVIGIGTTMLLAALALGSAIWYVDRKGWA